MMNLITALFPMGMAVLGYAVLGKDENKYYFLAMGTTIVTFIFTVILAVSPAASFSLNWVCDLGIHLEMDGFRKVYCIIIAFMWMMTMLLSFDYFRHHHRLSRYYFFNLMTEGATLGVFMAGDLATALIFFEVMSFTSFPWVIQEETDGAIRAANTYLAVAVIGGLTALMGLFLLSNALGTLTLSELYAASQAYSNKTLLFVAGVCILVGFGAKAGMYPLHIWLPKAHPVAPAPSSALLSGILTKSGIWGILAVTINIFRYDPAWGQMILILGTITMFLGALLALFSIDLKRTLACSSMSQIGFILVAVGMMVLLGEENALAARGAILHMVNHSLFKLVLFMCAGAVYMNTHELDLNKIKGFGRNKPFLMVCFLLAAAGIAGIPGLNGYVSKTLIHEAIVEGSGEYGYLKVIEWIFLVSGGLTLAYMTKLFVCLFVTKNPAFEEKQKYMSVSSYIAIGGSAILCPVLGLTCYKSMMPIADFCMDFFHGAEMEEMVAFFGWESLKGGLISIAIGAAVYIFLVRTLMIENGTYVDLWPKKLDLEDMFYRPLLLKWLPDFFGGLSSLFADNVVTGALYFGSLRVTGVLSRFVIDSVDLLVMGLRRTIYRNSPSPSLDSAASTLSYKLGNIADTLKPVEGQEHYHAKRAYRTVTTLKDGTHKMSDTLSFALLMMVAAIVVTLLYVLIVHNQNLTF